MSDEWGSYECLGKEGYEQPKLRTLDGGPVQGNPKNYSKATYLQEF